MNRTTRWPAIAAIASAMASLALATPTVTFPFNSQVPDVARTNQQYSFQLSSSTFASQDTLAYSLSQQPAWLSIDSANRTLLGTPGDADVGSTNFTITAKDDSGAADMECILVIASDPAPQLQGDFSQQLASEVNLTSTTPATVAITPGTQFSFYFQQDSFIDIVQRKLYYYATLADHTPLPSWLQFDSSSLTFTGTAPQLSAFPQSFAIALIASDYVGFAGASATFDMVIATQQLVFVPSTQTVHFQPGVSLNFSLAQSVYVDGQQLATSQLQSASATLPSWASFDTKSLIISGSPPQSGGAGNGTVVITDEEGNTAQVALQFTASNSSFLGTIGTITATAGQQLDYTIPTSVVDDPSVTLSLIVPTAVSWMSLDPSAHVIHGLVPSDASATTVQATLQAAVSGTAGLQSQEFAIDIEGAATTTDGSTTATSASPTRTTSTPTLAGSSGNSAPSKLSRGDIAAIVICSIIGAAILLALLICCCCRRRRRRRSQESSRQSTSLARRLISGPLLIVEKHPDMITVTTQMQRDVEKTGEGMEHESADEDKPPQLAVEIPAPNVRTSKLGIRASSYSQVSSIGHGADAIIRDANIPEWGVESAALQRPHDSFSVPTEIARESRPGRSGSPSKRASERLQQRRSRQSVGLGIDTSGGASDPDARRSTKRSGKVKKKASSAGLSATLDRSSCASLSTQATSLLSTKASEFPRPPTQSTFSARSRSIPTLSILDPERRRSIRMVGRSDSMTDPRPIAQKRESFIRARASTSLQSPLFSHGSRVPVEHRGPRGSSSDISSGILDRWRSKRYGGRSNASQSSSLTTSEHDSRRLSQRVRSVFAPNFPRVISGSDYTLDEEVEDAVEDDFDDNWEDVTPAQSRMQSANNVQDLAAEMSKPRHLRSWVLPGEASPTPPPPPPGASTSEEASEQESRRPQWKKRVTKNNQASSSPLAYTAVAVPQDEEQSPTIPKKSPKRRHSYINEPIGLVSKDSLSRGRGSPRPRLGETKYSRPISVDKVERLSSFKAETMDAEVGSETHYEHDMQDAGMMGPGHDLGNDGTQKSKMSAKVFI